MLSGLSGSFNALLTATNANLELPQTIGSNPINKSRLYYHSIVGYTIVDYTIVDHTMIDYTKVDYTRVAYYRSRLQ